MGSGALRVKAGTELWERLLCYFGRGSLVWIFLATQIRFKNLPYLLREKWLKCSYWHVKRSVHLHQMWSQGGACGRTLESSLKWEEMVVFSCGRGERVLGGKAVKEEASQESTPDLVKLLQHWTWTSFFPPPSLLLSPLALFLFSPFLPSFLLLTRSLPPSGARRLFSVMSNVWRDEQNRMSMEVLTVNLSFLQHTLLLIRMLF